MSPKCSRRTLSIFVIVSGLVGNPESSSVHRRSSTSINQSPNSKFLGLSLSTTSLINAYYCVKTQSHTIDTMSSPVARCSLFSTSAVSRPRPRRQGRGQPELISRLTAQIWTHPVHTCTVTPAQTLVTIGWFTTDASFPDTTFPCNGQ